MSRDADLSTYRAKRDFERTSERRNPVSTQPESVLSGRTDEEVADQEADR